MIETLALTELGSLGLNTATVVIQYKMHRDLRDQVQAHKATQGWVEKIKAKLWPEVFGTGPDHCNSD